MALETESLLHGIRRAFCSDPDLFAKLLEVIPDEERAYFSAAQFLESFISRVDPSELSTIVKSLSLLKEGGLDINHPASEWVITDDEPEEQTYTLAQVVVNMGSPPSTCCQPGADQLYYAFIDQMEAIGVDFNLEDYRGRNAYTYAKELDGTNLFNHYIKSRNLYNKLSSDLNIDEDDEPPAKIGI
ncbi:hypothetical protein [Paraburkholderia aromaticivorans]|uniref:hypothetical protein n=1 Tax=Paraburkholderia aromaticivorans TaxID=2026199 RepID=UPI0038BD3D62